MNLRLLVPLAALLAQLPLEAAPREGERIIEALGLCEGMTVADVGAGDGEYTSVLGRKVGAAGRVYATEVEQDKLDEALARTKKDGLSNVTGVLGDQDQTGLPASCCDAILLRMVYHHFTDPAAMRRSLMRALRPSGRIAVIDVPPQKSWRHLEGVPERGGHGILEQELLAEMRGEGFEVVSRHAHWPGEKESYCVVFRRPADRKPVAAPDPAP